MNASTTIHRLGLVAFVALCAAGPSLADAPPPMTKQEFKAAQARIETVRKTELEACKRLKERAADLCKLQAKGREEVALARLQAAFEPSPEADRAVKEAEADATLALAKVRCEDAAAHARKACRKQAQHDHEAAVRLAKVEKVEELRDQKRADDTARKTAAAD